MNHLPETGRPAQVPISREITYQGVQVQVLRLKDGGRLLQVVDPVGGILHNFPLTPQGAREIGNELASAVPTATADQMPKDEAT